MIPWACGKGVIVEVVSKHGVSRTPIGMVDFHDRYVVRF